MKVDAGVTRCSWRARCSELETMSETNGNKLLEAAFGSESATRVPSK